MVYLAFLFAIAVYYYLGGERFPDYENYLTLLENDIAGAEDSKALFEWISKYSLRFIYYVCEDLKLSVDLFVGFVQLYFLICMAYIRHKKIAPDRGILYYVLIMGPLLLTTTVRATPAYVGVAYFLASNGRDKYGALFLMFIAIVSHDSALVVALLLAISWVIHEWKIFANNMGLILIAGYTISYFGADYFGGIQLLLIQLNLGDRATYFSEAAKLTLIKSIYWLFVGCVVWIYVRTHEKEWRSVFFVTSYLSFSIIFVVSNIMAMRFSSFIVGSIVLISGSIIAPSKNGLVGRYVNSFLAFSLFGMSFLDILSNTGKV